MIKHVMNYNERLNLANEPVHGFECSVVPYKFYKGNLKEHSDPNPSLIFH